MHLEIVNPNMYVFIWSAEHNRVFFKSVNRENFLLK